MSYNDIFFIRNCIVYELWVGLLEQEKKHSYFGENLLVLLQKYTQLILMVYINFWIDVNVLIITDSSSLDITC